MKWLLCLSVVFVFTASAADMSGTWKATVETPNGPLETTFSFKVGSEKLTGTVANQFTGETALADGRVDGDKISFFVSVNFHGNDSKLRYQGKDAGDGIKLTVTIPGQDRTFEMTAKRVANPDSSVKK